MLPLPQTNSEMAEPPQSPNRRCHVEKLRGHFFELDLFIIEESQSPVGGTLQFGADNIPLERDHACHLADRVRSAIDNAIAGTIVHRSGENMGGH